MSQPEYVTKMKALVIFCLALAGCSNSGTGGGRDQYTIQVNAFGANLGTGAASLVVTESSSGASVTFSGTAASQTLNHQFASGDSYSLSIKDPTNPAQKCVFTSGAPSGSVSGNLTVGITCSIVLVKVSGSVTGLEGSALVLQFSNGTPATQTLSADGIFSFSVPSGSPYTVTAASLPSNPAETCSYSPNASGTVVSAAISDVLVTCKSVPFSISGTVTNLIGATGLTLTDGVSGSSPVSLQPSNLNQPVPFTLTNIPSGATYNLVASNPQNPVQTCTPTAGSATGKMGDTNIQNIVINCTTATYPISFTLAGSTEYGIQATLLVNGAPFSSLLVTCNSGDPYCGNPAPAPAQYTFPNFAPSGSDYQVVVSAQNDSGSNCLVWNVGGSGTLGGASPPPATIVCHAVPTYAFSAGYDSKNGTAAAALFTLVDPSAPLGFLTAFTTDPIDLALSTQVSFVASSGGLGDYIAQYDSGAYTSTISYYVFDQPPNNSPPNYNLYQTVTFTGEIDAMLFDASDNTILVCYEQGNSLYFQAYSAGLVAIGTPTLLTANNANAPFCSLYLATNGSVSQPSTFVYAYYEDSATQNYSLYGFNLGPSTTPPSAVTPVGSGAVTVAPLAANVNYPSVDPMGRFLYVVNSACGGTPYVCQANLTGFTIDKTSGVLTPIATNGPLLSSGNSVFYPLLYEPSGTFTYVPDGSAIVPFAINADGTLSSTLNGVNLKSSSTGYAISYAAIDPSGSFLLVNSYSSNYETSKVLTYRVSPTDGSLSELPPISLAASSYYGPPVIDPSGQYAYVASYQNSMATGYTSTFDSYSLSLSGLQSIPGSTGLSKYEIYNLNGFIPGFLTNLVLQ